MEPGQEKRYTEVMIQLRFVTDTPITWDDVRAYVLHQRELPSPSEWVPIEKREVVDASWVLEQRRMQHMRQVMELVEGRLVGPSLSGFLD